MTKKTIPTEPKSAATPAAAVEKRTTAPEKTTDAAEKKPARKPPINPFTAENGRKLGRGGKNGPSRTAWKA